ncbi:MAG TPA: hypothetical protein VL400_20185 [Polyangiaceae bacterium]|nr:hypothetical protein [Polyangiaceae bacterium]
MTSTSRAIVAFLSLCALGTVQTSVLAQPAGSAAPPSGSAAPTQDQPPTQGQPTQQQPTQGQPTQGQPTQGQPTQQQPTQGQPTQQQPTQQQPPQQQPPQGTWAGPPAPGQVPPGYGGYPPPGYGPQMQGGYYPGYGPPPPQGPPPLPPEDEHEFRFAARFDPFDLIFRRLSFQAELAIWGPFSIEAEPSWIFDSATENLDISGGALNGNILVYFTGDALKGFFVKATVGFEKYDATLTDPGLSISATKTLASPIIGVGIGSSTVFGDDFGFNLSGGIGIGFYTAEKQDLTAGRYQVTFYDKSGAIQLLASLGLGLAL